jgi:XTP/dITP diphosphohydrolase
VNPRRLCIATRNVHKLEEIGAVLAGLGLEVSGAADHPGCGEVEEDALTLEGNAEKKARWVAAFTGLPTLADDTGLEVDALQGAPGVYSARWAGPGCTYADNNAKLMRELATVPPERRAARFRCVIAFARPQPGADRLGFAERVAACTVSLHPGSLEGRIVDTARGGHGFGYDPVFFIPELGRTLAELSLEEKNGLSHRGRALAAARRALVEYFGPASGARVR